MTWDSNNQYLQALSNKYDLWFPPIMAVAWHVALKAAPWGTGLLTVHLALWWSAIAVISFTLSRLEHKRAAWTVLVVGALPIFVMLNSFVLKDVGLTGCIALAFAVAFWRRASKGHMTPVAALSIVLLITYASLVRQNGVFAAAPIACYAFAPTLISRPLRLLLACLLICVVAIGLAGPINRKIIGATGLDAKRSLVLYDMTGIAYWSRDPSIFQRQHNPSIQTISSCYSAELWDKLSRQPCDGTVGREFVHASTLARAIVKHPVAYLEHRIAHFNQELFFWTSADSWQWDDTNRPAGEPVGRYDNLQRGMLPALQSSPFLSPALALALLTILLIVMFSRRQWAVNETHRAAFYLALSGEAYALGYLLIGVANMYRYYEYTLFSCVIALMLIATTSRDRSTQQNRELAVSLSASAVCVLIITSIARAVVH